MRIPSPVRPVRPTVGLLVGLLALPVALPAAAETPISPNVFREYAEGYTLYFERDGEPFGAERFEPGGDVTWRFADGNCVEGVWRAYGAQVCFLYDGTTEVQCWRMLRDGSDGGGGDGLTDGQLLARLLGDGPDAGLELRVVRRDRGPLLCSPAGPEL